MATGSQSPPQTPSCGKPHWTARLLAPPTFFLLLLGVVWGGANFHLGANIDRMLLVGSQRKCMSSGSDEVSCTDSQLTDFHIRLEGNHCSQDESPCVGNQRSPDVPQELQRFIQAVQQVQTADHIILDTSLLPLIYTQNSEQDDRHDFQIRKSYFLNTQYVISTRGFSVICSVGSWELLSSVLNNYNCWWKSTWLWQKWSRMR